MKLLDNQILCLLIPYKYTYLKRIHTSFLQKLLAVIFLLREISYGLVLCHVILMGAEITISDVAL